MNVYSQDFETQIYYNYDTTYNSVVHGNIRNITDSDSLARIYFRSDAMFLNSYIACTYNFQSDTLFLTEIEEDVYLDYRIEKRSIANAPTDSIYFTYQVYYESGGNAIYDSLEFRV